MTGGNATLNRPWGGRRREKRSGRGRIFVSKPAGILVIDARDFADAGADAPTMPTIDKLSLGLGVAAGIAAAGVLVLLRKKKSKPS